MDASDTTKKSKIPLVITGLVVIILSAAAVFFFMGKSKDITVGDARYMNACNVLPESAVSSVFGTLPGSSRVVAEYVDESLPNDRRYLPHNQIDTTCTYQYEDELQNGPVLKIQLRQLSQAKDQNDETYATKVPIGVDSAAESIKQYEAIEGSLTNADAKAFLSHLSTSSKAFVETKVAAIAGTLEEDKKSDTRLNGVTFAAPKTGDTLDTEALSFVGIEKGFIVIVTHQLAKADKAVKKYSPAELEAELVAMKKAFDIIRKNLGDSKLSQAPRAAFAADQQKNGATQLLDPCQILDAATFEQITGVKQNDIVISQSMRLDMQERTMRSGVSLPAGSNCMRNYHALLAPDSYTLTDKEQQYSKQGGIKVALQLWQDQSKQEAETVWVEIAKQEKCRAITTDADKAVSCVKDSDQSELVYFLSGAHIGQIDMVAFGKTERLKGDGVAIEAINAVVANMKTAQEK